MTHVLRQDRFRGGDFVRSIYSVTPENGTPDEALLNPAYWAHVAKHLRSGDKIEVLAEDGSYYAEFLVAGANATGALVRELAHKRFDALPAQVIDEGEYEIRWSGPVNKHRVIRKSDKAILAEGEMVATKEQAQLFLRDYLKALAA